MLDILGVGDAIVDKIIVFDETDPVMQKILPVKGLFFIATPEEHSYLREKPSLADYAGGSAANTIRNMALLGAKAGFIGKAGCDREGDFFEASLTEYNVQSYLIQTSQDKTGCSVVMVHQDKDRTQCARPCAANLLETAEVTDELLKNTKSILTEGYMINRRPDLVEEVILRAKFFGAKVYLTLSDVHCVQNKKELILKLLPKMDILFGNEYEFEALQVAPDMLKDVLCVKTCGAKGVEIFSKNENYFFQAPLLDTIQNTNGAGDGFAAGFLLGLHQNFDFETCALKGHFVAQEVLKTNLSYLPKDFVKKA
ncbi:MAG: adenosine kinase [Alphaproteobacteria bacterium]|nr:adenosine kinase [Alphaproteobacteria bacterium]